MTPMRAYTSQIHHPGLSLQILLQRSSLKYPPHCLPSWKATGSRSTLKTKTRVLKIYVPPLLRRRSCLKQCLHRRRRKGPSKNHLMAVCILLLLSRHLPLRSSVVLIFFVGFKRVEKPKRFFSVGRIFKTVWFEPRGSETPVRRADLEWSDSCTTAFYDKKPVAKFRWFVVVRKRLNHSLCFSITTFAGPGTARSRRGRAVDFVVLHSSDIEPPKPYDEEGITRPPIGVIIEEDEQYISPLARLDCSRLFTVEDDLDVMKIGRVNPESIPHLENYYKECVQ